MSETTTTKTTVQRFKRAKECQGCVKFDAIVDSLDETPAMKNAYVSRSVPGINEAKTVRLTIEVER